MSLNCPANERLQLYERFKKSLTEGVDSEFFDADELVIIIDQAVDLDDEYVQIEALMRGYRFFPENEELANRRAFLYFDLNLDAGVKNMITNKTDNSPMWDILHLRNQEGEISNLEEAQTTLENLLKRAEKFDDETVIQFVDCASAIGLYDWLKLNEKAIRRKVDYLPTLLYELFIVADLHNDSEYSIALLEELTEIEPFNGDFWSALAQVQFNSGQYDDALNAIEYALAIDSDNYGVLGLKAAIFTHHEQFEPAIKIIDKLARNHNSALVGELKARAYWGLEKCEETLQVVSDYHKLFPEDRTFPEIALFLRHPAAEQILENHYEATGPNSLPKWEEWTHNLYSTGRIWEASKILQCLRNHKVLDFNGYKTLATSLYCCNSYTEAAKLLEDALEREHEALVPDVIIAGLLSLVHLEKKRDAKRTFKKVMAKIPLSIKGEWTLSSALEGVGFSGFLGHLNMLLETPGAVDINDIDIFDFPLPRNINND